MSTDIEVTYRTHVLVRIVDWIFLKFNSPQQCLNSPSLLIFDDEWYVTIYPQGKGTENAGFISLFLRSKSRPFQPTTLRNRNIPVQISFSIINMYNKRCNTYSAEIPDWKWGSFNEHRCPRFISRIELEEKGLVIDNKLKIRCEIKIFPDGIVQNKVKKVSGKHTDNIYGKFGFTNFDLVVKVKNQEFKAHKVFLTAHSEVFAAMLKHGMIEASSNVITINDITPTVFKEFLRFLYTKEVKNLTLAEYQELTACADKYSVIELKELCCKEMLEEVSRSNAIDLLIFAEKYSLSNFKTELVRFISLIPSVITTAAGWNQLYSHPQLLKEVVCSMASSSEPASKRLKI
ncbi:hypothetical protein GE061_012306 [Apolygus lucorum]|uniref:BTB domain-containing protein n=1 Tax=Apolygus lucorum TaxID=248454 RepID=A0A8S9XU00_APOLU|nr:hypothetical protein GE061_012306 [Apolygus lucorum]